MLGRQVLRSGTSVAANYRAVCRARSRADFISKLSVVTEETDETVFWLELLIETGVVPKARLEKLLTEAGELIRIFRFFLVYGQIEMRYGRRSRDTPTLKLPNQATTG